jgi:predicted permease
MLTLAQEFRQGTREALARPAFSALVIAVLAAGLATVLYVMTVLNGMIIKPLPFPNAERLYVGGIQRDGDDDEVDPIAQRDLEDWQRRLDGYAELGGWQEGTVNLADGARVERLDGAFVTPNLFDLLGVAPHIGGAFAPGDIAPNAAIKAVLSHEVWRSRYLADPGVIGRTVRVNGETATIVGVMPERFSFPARTQIFVPARSLAGSTARSTDRFLTVMLSVADAGDLPAIRTALDAWHAEATAAEPNAFQRSRVNVVPLAYLFADTHTRTILGVMLAATLLVLLVACANAANLMLARNRGHVQELALRMALGASRGRVVLHLFMHSLALALAAALIALVLAYFATQWTMQSFQDNSDGGPPSWMRFEIDPALIGAALLAALLTAVVTGVLPALKVSAQAGTTLREGGRGMAGGSGARISGLLVAVEIALSCALLIGAGVMVRTVQRIGEVDLGVRTENVLTARIGLFDSAFPTPASRIVLFDRLRERLRQEGEVVDATLSTALPGLMSGYTGYLAEGAAPEDVPHDAQLNSVDERFLSTYGVDLLAGRFIGNEDRADSEPVAVVDAKFAAAHGGVAEMVGKRYQLGPRSQDARTVTIVGVVGALRLDDPSDDPVPAILVPMQQRPANFVSLAVQVRGEPRAFAPRLAEIMREVEPDTPLYWVRDFDQVLAVATFGENILARIYSVFGIIALLLAAGGLYGVVAYAVGQRTREIGVRRALGASNRRVIDSVLRRSGWQVGIGLAVGLLLGIPFAQMLAGSLEGLELEPVIWLVVGLLLAAVALIAALVPARRALRTDPMEALRYE